MRRLYGLACKKRLFFCLCVLFLKRCFPCLSGESFARQTSTLQTVSIWMGRWVASFCKTVGQCEIGRLSQRGPWHDRGLCCAYRRYIYIHMYIVFCHFVGNASFLWRPGQLVFKADLLTLKQDVSSRTVITFVSPCGTHHYPREPSYFNDCEQQETHPSQLLVSGRQAATGCCPSPIVQKAPTPPGATLTKRAKWGSCSG
jgi:hypothetical protein